MGEQDDIIKRLIETSPGRRSLASTMIAPLRQGMDYKSVGRRAFMVEPLDPPCGVCRRTDYDEGHKAGCKECSVRSILGT